MANSFKRAMALTLAAAMVATAVPATNFGTINADAASYKVTGTTAPYTKTTNKYVIKGLKKGMYAKVSVTGNAKSKVTVKQGSKKIKASTKIKGTGKNITLKVTNKAAAGKKYNVVVKYFNKKGKRVKKITKKATIYAQTTSVTITPVTGAAITGASINVTGASIQVGTSITLTAAKTPEKNTKKITWKSSDAKVAKVVDGVVTALGAGKATITATSGKASASYEVTVDDSNVAAKIVASGSKQVAADKITLAFDKSAKTLTKNDITVERDDKTATIPVKAVNFSEDGKTAEVVLFGALQDKKTYVVSQSKDSDNFTFEAKVGAPASFLVKTANAERGVETKIEYSILDDTGMDVTAAVQDIKSVVSARIKEGSTYDSYDFDKSNDLKIKLAKVGDTATVELKYNNETTKSTFTQDAVITCIEATEKKGTPMFAQVKEGDTNKKSECAKFYSMTTTSSSVYVNADDERDDVYFCALDKNGDAIDYESYEVTSGNSDVLSVSLEKDNGKFARIRLIGNKTGNTVVNVKATVNSIASNYTIPVVVKSKKELGDLKLSLSRSKMSNAFDLDYSTILEVKAYDKNGDELKNEDGHNDFSESDWSAEIVDADKKEGINSVEPGVASFYDGLGVDESLLGFRMVGHNEFTAYGAKDGSYKIKVTASVGGIEKTKEISVSVTALKSDIYNTDNLQTVKYEVELLDGAGKPIDNTFDENDDDEGNAYLAAKVGSTFVGYVHQDWKDGIGYTWIGSYYKQDTTGDDALSTAVATGVTFTATESDAALNGVHFQLVSAASIRATASVASGVVFTAGPKAYDELNGVKIMVCSNGVAANGQNVVDGNYAANVNWIVRSGDVIYVNVNNNVAAVDTNSGEAIATYFTGEYTTGNVYAETGSALGAYPETFASITAKASDDATSDKSFAGFKAPYAIEEDLDYDDETIYPVVKFTYADDDKDDPDAVAEAYNELIADADVDYKFADMFVAEEDGLVVEPGETISDGGNSGVSGYSCIIKPTEATEIRGIVAGVKRGSYYSDGPLYNFGIGDRDNRYDEINGHKGMSIAYTDLTDAVFLHVDTVNKVDGRYYVPDDTTNDLYFAKKDTYTATFEYVTKKGKTEKATKDIKVVNNMYIPKVTVLDKTLSSLDEDEITKALKVDVDLNNNEGNNASIDGEMKKEFRQNGFSGTNANYNEGISSSNGKTYVKYVPVMEDNVRVYVKIGENFDEEK